MPHSTMYSTLDLHPAAPGLIFEVSKNIFSRNALDVAEICSWRLSEQWLENVNQTHLVQARWQQASQFIGSR